MIGTIIRWFPGSINGTDTSIVLPASNELRTTLQGNTVAATVQDDEKLHWSNGEVWERLEANSP